MDTSVLRAAATLNMPQLDYAMTVAQLVRCAQLQAVSPACLLSTSPASYVSLPAALLNTYPLKSA